VRGQSAEIADFRREIDVHASARCSASASSDQDRFAICLQINGSAAALAGDGPKQADPGDVMFVDLLQELAVRHSAPEAWWTG
jgi:hypothetical protein